MIRGFFFVLVLGFLSTAAIAQNDSLRQKKADSILNKTQSALDKKLVKADSAASNLSSKLNSVGNLQVPDSLGKDLNKYNQKLNTIKQKLTHRLDSLKESKQPTDRYTHLLDSLEKSGPMKNVKEAEAKLAKLEAKVNEPMNKVNSSVSNLNNTINSKLSELNKEGIGVPSGVSLPAGQVPTLGGLPATNLPNGTIPGVNNPLQGTHLPTTVGGLPSKPTSSSLLKNVDGLSDVQKEITEVNKVTGQTKTYMKEAKDIGKGDLSKAKNISKEAEEQAAKLEGVKELQKETKVLDEYKKKVAIGNNPEEMKKLAEQEIKKEAVNHFAGKEEVLKQAMGQMEKYKLKYPNAATINDLTKRVRNEMYGKPFIERIVPAFSLQIISKGDVLIDVNPQVGYRLSGKWTAGIGWVERIQFHTITTVVQEGRIFGPRAYTDIKWKKGFGLRAEVECLNMYVAPANTPTGDGDTHPWVWGVLAGIKKDYKIAKGVNGNIQVLYKVDSPLFFENPYPDKINIRIGMEFPLRKQPDKKKK